jgi:hypothetical protein
VTSSFFSSVNRMGDFKTAFVEGFGKSLAYGIGGIIFLLILALLGGTGWLTIARSPSIRGFATQWNKPSEKKSGDS